MTASPRSIQINLANSLRRDVDGFSDFLIGA
jgi:hypothetical protein